MAGASRPVSSLRDLAVIRGVLDALTVRLDGKPAAATSVYRKRAVFYNALGLAVERRLLLNNPVDQVQWTAPDVAEAVDRRVVASPAQVCALLDAVRDQPRRGEYLVAFFGCLYYAGMRPAEVVALRAGDCELPTSGWGRLQLARSEPWAGQEWTNNGEARERRALKRRASNTVRTVPIPAELVGLLRAHLETFGTGEAGAVFRNERGGPFNEASARRTWAKARLSALTEEQVHSPLARRPYDLRHAAASLWLNNSVPPRRSPGGSAMTWPSCSRSTPTASTDRKDRSMTGSPPLSRPTTTMRHCPRRQPWTLRPSQTRGLYAVQNQRGRLWTRQNRRSALVAQGIEHRFPKPCVAGSNPAGGTMFEQTKH